MITVIPRYYNPTLSVSMSGQEVRFAGGEGLQVRFRVERTLTQTPDKCEVEITGMDPIRAALMVALFGTMGTDVLTVKAGYDGITAGLFRGDVRTVDGPRRIGRDDVLRLVADDGGEAITQTPIRISNAAMTAAQMVQVAAAAMGLLVHPSVATALATADPTTQGPFTSVMTAKASDLLDAACRRVRARWRVQDGQIILSALGAVDLTRPAVLLTGAMLVQAPALGGESGVSRFVSFLDPNIVPGSQVAYLAARYRAEHVVYSGETRSSPWTTEVTGSVL